MSIMQDDGEIIDGIKALRAKLEDGSPAITHGDLLLMLNYTELVWREMMRQSRINRDLGIQAINAR